MPDKIEKLIDKVWQNWQGKQVMVSSRHPDEETLACFIERKLIESESEQVILHLIGCGSCMDKVIAYAKLNPSLAEDAVPETIAEQPAFLEIVLRLKDKLLELVNTTGDVLVGQELMPAPILRARKIKDFKDEVMVLKDFEDVRVEAKIENRPNAFFSLTVMAKDKNTQKVIKDLRITLMKDELELESYHTDTGRAVFENVAIGRYMVEISRIEKKIASVIVDIRS